MIKCISHIGVAVRDVEQAIELYGSVFGLEVPLFQELAEMKVCMVKIGDSHIELMQPTTTEGLLARFMERRGEGIHHICFEVDDIEKEIGSLSAKGVELIDKQPLQGIEGLVAFLHPRRTNGVLIELVQKGEGHSPQSTDEAK